MPSGSLQDRVSRKNPEFFVWPEMWEWCQMEAFRTEDSLFWGQNINTIKNLVFDKPCIFIKVTQNDPVIFCTWRSFYEPLVAILFSLHHNSFVGYIKHWHVTMVTNSIFYILSSKRFYCVLDIKLLSWLWFVNLYGCNGFYEKKMKP